MLDQIKELKNKGLSIREIAEQLNISKSQVHRILSQDQVSQDTVPESVVPEESTVPSDSVPIDNRRIKCVEDIYDVPIVKLFGWKFTPQEEEQILTQQGHIVNGLDMLRL